MSEVDVSSLVNAVHAQPTHILLAITGGGTRAIAELLEIPGGSRCLLEAVVPYSAKSLDAWLGSAPEQYGSARTARAMAAVGYQRARRLAKTNASQEPGPVACIAATSSLVSDRPKRGPHRVNIAWQTQRSTAELTLELNKGARTRHQEEQLVASLILNEIAAATDADVQLPVELLPGETPIRDRVDAPAVWQNLIDGVTRVAFAGEDISLAPRPSSPAALLFPGAFNPLHDGHRQMAAIASRRYDAPIVYEISITNVDKPPLDFIEMRNRAQQFCSPTAPLAFTRAATFVEKSELFLGATFVVGLDTIERIASSRYYVNEMARDVALINIASRRCRFLVFGRLQNGDFRTLDHLKLPYTLREICEQVPQEEFRVDLSSTELRTPDSEEHH